MKAIHDRHVHVSAEQIAAVCENWFNRIPWGVGDGQPMKTDTPRNHDIFTACPTLPFPPKLQQPPFPSNEQAAIQGLATERVSMTQDVKHRARQNTPHEAPRAYSNHPIKSQGLLLFCRITHKHTTQTKSGRHTHTHIVHVETCLQPTDPFPHTLIA